MKILEGFPKILEFAALFETTGWNNEYQLTVQEMEQALGNSWLVISAYEEDGTLIGFGRVVTDKVMHAMIYDLIVRPEYQNRGIGAKILDRLVKACLDEGIRDIQLFCATGKRGFYEKRGFVARLDAGPGMQFRRKA